MLQLLRESGFPLETHFAWDTVEVTFPDDYGAEHLAGKTARFAVTVKEGESYKRFVESVAAGSQASA